MISTSIIIALLTGALFTTLVPAAILLVLAVRKKISGLPLLTGAAAFFLSQMVLRLPLLSVLSTQNWMQDFAALSYYPYIIILCLSAGLFEESARLGGALLLKNRRSYKDVLSFGLGHGFCEVILLVGLSYISNLMLCLIINSGNETFMAALPPETAALITDQLKELNPPDILWGIIERVSAVLFHLFATVLVFLGVVKKKWFLFILAILAHTAFNLVATVMLHILGTPMLWLTEIILLLFALAAGFYVLKSRKSFAGLDAVKPENQIPGGP